MAVHLLVLCFLSKIRKGTPDAASVVSIHAWHRNIDSDGLRRDGLRRIKPCGHKLRLRRLEHATRTEPSAFSPIDLEALELPHGEPSLA